MSDARISAGNVLLSLEGSGDNRIREGNILAAIEVIPENSPSKILQSQIIVAISKTDIVYSEIQVIENNSLVAGIQPAGARE